MCSCHICQTNANKERHLAIPLQPMYEVHSFVKSGLDFIGLVSPQSSTGHKFILIAIYYCTQWMEAMTFKNCTAKVVTDFLEEHIVTRFGMPFVVDCNNGPAFTSAFLT